MKAYIVGAISSDPHYRSKFADAEMVLREQGYTVFNPACLPEGWGYETYMSADEPFLREADVVVLLPDWVKSSGGRREHGLAMTLQKQIVRYQDLEVQCG